MDKKTFKDYGFETLPQSFWVESSLSTDYPILDKDIKVDVAIVGGGIVGITLGYLLKQEGVRVAIIEADRIALGATGHTTAKITSQHNLLYGKIITHFGKEKAQQYANANESAITFIEEIVKEKNIDCDFSRQSAYIYTQLDEYIEKIQDEVNAASKIGIKASFTDVLPLPFNIKAALCFENQAQFHPRKYILPLAYDIPGEGSYIFERSRAIDFHEGHPSTVITKDGNKVTAEKLVIASHFPAYGSNGYYFARMYPERSYALGIRTKQKFPGGMYITAEKPTRSLRLTPYKNGALLIVSGEHHKTGQGENTNLHYKNLINFANDIYDIIDIPFRWSTQDYTTLDDIPFVGNITSKSPSTYVATGFKKWGMTNGTASAILLKDLIVRGESPWAPLYNPSRFKAEPMIKNFAITNIDVAKHLIGDKLKPIPKDIDIAPGEAVIVEDNGKKLGVYKDKKGKLHAVDPVCTHMGCNLAWNAAELSWDCPCHGSRFTYEGDIIEGPGLKSLKTNEFRFNP